MTTIQQTQPVTPVQIFATIGIIALAILGIAKAPNLDAHAGIIVFGTSASIVLGIVTYIGLNTTWRHSSFNQFAQRALNYLKRNRTTIVVTAFGLGASLAIGVYAHAVLGLTIGVLQMTAFVALWLQQKRGFSRIVA